MKTFATGRYNTDPKYIIAEGTEFPTGARNQLLLAISGKTGGKQLKTGDKVSFEYNGTTYTLTVLDAEGDHPVYAIAASRFVASALLGKINKIDPEFDTPEIREALAERAKDKKAKETTLEVGEHTFKVSTVAKETVFELAGDDSVLVTYDAFLPLSKEYEPLASNFAFIERLYEATGTNEKSFVFDGKTFEVLETENETELHVNGEPVMLISDIAFGAFQVGTELSSDFLIKTSEAIRTNTINFSFTDSKGTETDARINLVNGNYYIETAQKTQLLLVTDAPSKEHLLGTDNYGMDLLTRLMYGGRVSLMVGFVVIFFETFLGVILGGISGYFGGWTDTMLMWKRTDRLLRMSSSTQWKMRRRWKPEN